MGNLEQIVADLIARGASQAEIDQAVAQFDAENPPQQSVPGDQPETSQAPQPQQPSLEQGVADLIQQGVGQQMIDDYVRDYDQTHPEAQEQERQDEALKEVEQQKDFDSLGSELFESDKDSIKTRFDKGNFKVNEKEAYDVYKNSGTLDPTLLGYDKSDEDIEREVKRRETIPGWARDGGLLEGAYFTVSNQLPQAFKGIELAGSSSKLEENKAAQKQLEEQLAAGMDPNALVTVGGSISPRTGQRIGGQRMTAEAAMEHYNNVSKQKPAEILEKLGEIAALQDEAELYYNPVFLDGVNAQDIKGAVGRQVPQLLFSAATFGLGAFGQEYGSAYVDNLYRIAETKFRPADWPEGQPYEPTQEELFDIIDSGADERGVAVGTGAISGSLEYLGAKQAVGLLKGTAPLIGRLLKDNARNAIQKFAGREGARLASTVLQGGLVEGLTELGQGIAQDVGQGAAIGQGIGDSVKEIEWHEKAEEFVQGGFIGALLPGLGGSARVIGGRYRKIKNKDGSEETLTAEKAKELVPDEYRSQDTEFAQDEQRNREARAAAEAAGRQDLSLINSAEDDLRTERDTVGKEAVDVVENMTDEELSNQNQDAQAVAALERQKDIASSDQEIEIIDKKVNEIKDRIRENFEAVRDFPVVLEDATSINATIQTRQEKLSADLESIVSDVDTKLESISNERLEIKEQRAALAAAPEPNPVTSQKLDSKVEKLDQKEAELKETKAELNNLETGEAKTTTGVKAKDLYTKIEGNNARQQELWDTVKGVRGPKAQLVEEVRLLSKPNPTESDVKALKQIKKDIIGDLRNIPEGTINLTDNEINYIKNLSARDSDLIDVHTVGDDSKAKALAKAKSGARSVIRQQVLEEGTGTLTQPQLRLVNALTNAEEKGSDTANATSQLYNALHEFESTPGVTTPPIVQDAITAIEDAGYQQAELRSAEAVSDRLLGGDNVNFDSRRAVEDAMKLTGYYDTLTPEQRSTVNEFLKSDRQAQSLATQDAARVAREVERGNIEGETDVASELIPSPGTQPVDTRNITSPIPEADGAVNAYNNVSTLLRVAGKSFAQQYKGKGAPADMSKSHRDMAQLKKQLRPLIAMPAMEIQALKGRLEFQENRSPVYRDQVLIDQIHQEIDAETRTLLDNTTQANQIISDFQTAEANNRAATIKDAKNVAKIRSKKNKKNVGREKEAETKAIINLLQRANTQSLPDLTQSIKDFQKEFYDTDKVRILSDNTLASYQTKLKDLRALKKKNTKIIKQYKDNGTPVPDAYRYDKSITALKQKIANLQRINKLDTSTLAGTGQLYKIFQTEVANARANEGIVRGPEGYINKDDLTSTEGSQADRKQYKALKLIPIAALEASRAAKNKPSKAGEFQAEAYTALSEYVAASEAQTGEDLLSAIKHRVREPQHFEALVELVNNSKAKNLKALVKEIAKSSGKNGITQPVVTSAKRILSIAEQTDPQAFVTSLRSDIKNNILTLSRLDSLTGLSKQDQSDVTKTKKATEYFVNTTGVTPTAEQLQTLLNNVVYVNKRGRQSKNKSANYRFPGQRYTVGEDGDVKHVYPESYKSDQTGFGPVDTLMEAIGAFDIMNADVTPEISLDRVAFLQKLSQGVVPISLQRDEDTDIEGVGEEVASDAHDGSDFKYFDTFLFNANTPSSLSSTFLGGATADKLAKSIGTILNDGRKKISAGLTPQQLQELKTEEDIKIHEAIDKFLPGAGFKDAINPILEKHLTGKNESKLGDALSRVNKISFESRGKNDIITDIKKALSDAGISERVIEREIKPELIRTGFSPTGRITPFYNQLQKSLIKNPVALNALDFVSRAESGPGREVQFTDKTKIFVDGELDQDASKKRTVKRRLHGDAATAREFVDPNARKSYFKLRELLSRELQVKALQQGLVEGAGAQFEGSQAFSPSAVTNDIVDQDTGNVTVVQKNTMSFEEIKAANGLGPAPGSYIGGLAPGIEGGLGRGFGEEARGATFVARGFNPFVDPDTTLPTEVNKADLIIDAALPGQIYKKVKFSGAQRGGAVLAGGKGGGVTDDQLASSLEDIKRSGKGKVFEKSAVANAAAKLMGVKPSEVLNNTSRSAALEAIRKAAKGFEIVKDERNQAKARVAYAAEGNISYGVNKRGGFNQREVTDADIDFLNAMHDKLAGYKDAHKYPERNWRITVENQLNQAPDFKTNPALIRDAVQGTRLNQSLTEASQLAPADNKWIAATANALSVAFPDVKISTTQQEWSRFVDGLKAEGRYVNPKLKGAEYAGQVAINPAQATKDTPIHEFAHIWSRQLQRSNPQLWKRGVELLKNTKYMEVVNNNPDYRALRENNLSAFYEEVMANALGKRGAQIFENNKTNAKKWNNFLDSVGAWIKDRLGIVSNKSYADLTLDDWLDLGAKSILSGDKTAFQTEISGADAAAQYSNNAEVNTSVGRSIKQLQDGVWGEDGPITTAEQWANADIDFAGMLQLTDQKQINEAVAALDTHFGKKNKNAKKAKAADPKELEASRQKLIKKISEDLKLKSYPLRGKKRQSLLYSDQSKYKRSKIDQGVRDVLVQTRLDFESRGAKLDLATLQNLDNAIGQTILNGYELQKGKNAARKAARANVSKNANSIIKGTYGTNKTVPDSSADIKRFAADYAGDLGTTQANKIGPADAKVIVEAFGDVLSNKWGKNIEFATTKQEIIDAIENSKLTRAEKDSKIKKWDTLKGQYVIPAGSGKVQLLYNDKIFDGGTPLHEFSHLWETSLNINAEGRKIKEAIRPLMKDSVHYDEVVKVMNSPQYKGIKQDSDEYHNEVFAQLISREIQYPTKSPAGKKLQKLVVDMFNYLSGLVGADTKYRTISQVRNAVVKDLMAGEQAKTRVAAFVADKANNNEIGLQRDNKGNVTIDEDYKGDTSEDAITSASDIQLPDVITKDQVMNEFAKRKGFNRISGVGKHIQRNGILGALANTLSPASNEDFYGLVERILPKKGKGREASRKYIDEHLVEPLKKANADFYNAKAGFRDGYKAIKTKHLGSVSAANKILNSYSGIHVNGGNLSNSQVSMIYNYLKDPSLYKQMTDGNVSYQIMDDIVTYMQADENANLKKFADDVPSLYANERAGINQVLNRHGYKGVDGQVYIVKQGEEKAANATKKDSVTKPGPEGYAILNKIFDNNIPERAVYTPFAAASNTDKVVEADFGLFDDSGGFSGYSVMSGNLAARQQGGKISIVGKSIDTMIEQYSDGPLRTKSYLDFARGASSFFNTQNLLTAEKDLGESWGKSMRDSLKRIITGRNETAVIPEQFKAAEKWLNRSIGGIMFINTKSALLQLVSIGNFMTDNPGAYFSAIGSASLQERQHAKKLIKESGFFKLRGANDTDVILDAIAKQEAKGVGRYIDNMLNKGYYFTKQADKMAISQGGIPYVVARLKSIKKQNPTWTNEQVEAQAMRDFAHKANEAQQSTSPDRLGRIQTTSAGRYILAFTNATQQFNRIIAKSLRQMQAGENFGGNLAKVSYFIGGQYMMFSFFQKAMANATFGDDEEGNEKDAEKWTGYVMGVIDSMATSTGLYGTLVSTLLNALHKGGAFKSSEDKNYFEKKTADAKFLEEILNLSPATGTKAREFRYGVLGKKLYPQSAISKYIDEDLTRAGYAIQGGTGLPVARAQRIIEGLGDAFVSEDLNFLERLQRAVGYSRYDLQKLLDDDEGYAGGEDSGGYSLTPLERSLPKGVMGRANRDGTIEVDPSLSPMEKQKTIAHEEEHQREMASGDLDYDDHSVTYHGKRYERRNGNIVVDGKEVPEGDSSLPWEQVAEEAETPLNNLDPRKLGLRNYDEYALSGDAPSPLMYYDRDRSLKFGSPLWNTDGTVPEPGSPEWEAARQEGVQFQQDWYADPTTQALLQEQAPRYVDKAGHIEDEVHFDRAPHLEEGEIAEYWRNPYADEAAGEHKHNVGLGPGQELTPHLAAHELTHAGGQDYHLGKETQKYLGVKGNLGGRYGRYLESPDEQYAHLQELRQQLNLDPSKRDLKPADIAKQVEEKGSDDIKAFIKNFNIENITEALNKVASTDNLNQLYNNVT